MDERNGSFREIKKIIFKTNEKNVMGRLQKMNERNEKKLNVPSSIPVHCSASIHPPALFFPHLELTLLQHVYL